MKDKIKRQLYDMWQDLEFWVFLRFVSLSYIILLCVFYFGFSYLPCNFTLVFTDGDRNFALSLIFMLFFYTLLSFRCSALERLKTIEAQCDCIIELLQKRLDDFDFQNGR